MKRYFDDENGQSEAFPPGTSLVGDMLVIKHDMVEVDKMVPADERIANIIKQIADKICPSIKVTVDYPSRHTPGYMPILDVEVKVKDNMILHRFYRKSTYGKLSAAARIQCYALQNENGKSYPRSCQNFEEHQYQ